MTNLERKKASPDWLIQGILTKVGDTFDRLTGRRWRPSSSLATSGLIERMKQLLDREAKILEDGRVIVPHNIKLKMQWDKFSTDAEDPLRKLESEFLIAAVDHINDRHYYTQAPLSIEVKPDYFTEGVKLFVGFEKFTDDETDAQINVSVPGIKVDPLASATEPSPLANGREIVFSFNVNGRNIERKLKIGVGQRLAVGRTKENEVSIDDISVSKYHASIMINAAGSLAVADTGSTNGTFVNGQRISYGKTTEIAEADAIKLGTVDVAIELLPVPEIPVSETEPDAENDSYKVGEFTFAGKTEVLTSEPSETEPAVTVAIPGDGNGQVREDADLPEADRT
ncbi:hypothetical protein BH24ACI3_BH24ACI3_15480 [soil metagenome]